VTLAAARYPPQSEATISRTPNQLRAFRNQSEFGKVKGERDIGIDSEPLMRLLFQEGYFL